jgi:hypothetical protein
MSSANAGQDRGASASGIPELPDNEPTNYIKQIIVKYYVQLHAQ